MKLSRLDLKETHHADKEQSHTIERVIQLTLDILYLLTGEDYIVLKMSYGRVTHSSSPCISGGFGRSQTSAARPPPPSVTPERNSDKKVLEVINEIIELLTGEDGRKERGFTSTLVKQEVNDALPSKDESSEKDTLERCPCPLYIRDEEEGLINREKSDTSQDTTATCVKKKTNVPERVSKVRWRGRPRRRRILATSPSPQPPLGPKDIHVIMEDFQGDTTEDDQQQVTTDLHSGWMQEKLSSLSVIKSEENRDDCAEHSKYKCKKNKWRHLPKESALLATAQGQEDIGESPGMDSARGTPADCSLHPIFSGGPGLSQDDDSEGTIVKVSVDDVQEVAELAEPADQRSCLNGKRKTFTCLDCGRCFSSSEQLKSHYKVHTGESPFSCMACGNSFASSEELGEHLRIHTSEKLFACSQCGKCFTMKASLIAHHRVHTGNKPFACAECGRRFALRSSLETHLPLHAIEKPYPCRLCGKCFATSGQLAVHQTTHTGDKSYECELCGKMFTTSSSMNRHRKTHTGEKPYACIVCGKCFNRETNLYRHQMIHTR